MMTEPYVCPTCVVPLKSSMAGLICPQCLEEFIISDGIPLLIPGKAYRCFPVRKIQGIYDRVYSNPGIMGTQLDPEYSRVTKMTLLDFCKGAPNRRILDVGTGDGDLWEFAPGEGMWHGVDLSEVGIRRARQRFPSLRAAVAVSEWLPFPDAYFGTVVAADTIEHAFDLEQSLGAIRRVLAEGGIFAFSVPTPNSLRKWGYNRILHGGAHALALVVCLIEAIVRRTLLFGQPVFQPIDRDLSLDEWLAMLTQTGFRVTAVQKWPAAPFKPIVYLISAQTSL